VRHKPVLLEEILQWLEVKPDGTYADMTLGTGGHTLEIAKRLTTGKVLGIDRDPQALAIARERLQPHERQVVLVQAEFSDLGEVAAANHFPGFDGIVADLGISSLELDTAERGFSFPWAGPLSMWVGPENRRTADE